MIKFFRLSKYNFVKQNQRSGRLLVEIAACGKIKRQSLKSKGFHTIKNDSLRNYIIELYDNIYFDNSHIIELKSGLNIGSNEMMNKRLFTTKDINHKIPNNYNELKNDTEFLNTLSHITAQNINF